MDSEFSFVLIIRFFSTYFCLLMQQCIQIDRPI